MAKPRTVALLAPLLAPLLGLALVTLAACRKDDTHAPSGLASASPQAAPDPAAEGKLCTHGVLEVVCPKCHPKLAAVFQAKGDWCAEHGFPESFCPICHPERGGKPKADVAAKPGDKAPADGTLVRLKTTETARLAGIETQKAVERPNTGGVVVPARLAYDATRLGQINARSPGVVRALKVDVGSVVKKNDPLVVIESAAVGADRSRLKAAEARVAAMKKNHERVVALQQSGFSAERDVLAAEQDLETAKAERAALVASLSILGAASGSGGSYTLSAPLSGVVTERNATVGKLVGLEEVLVEVVDTSVMWAELDVPEAELGQVALEQAVSLEIQSLAGRTFRGKITYLSPAIDPSTRTVRARAPMDNPDGALRANMFGHARITVSPSAVSVMVPDASVQRAKDVHLVFVRRADNEYETRRVELGVREGNLVEIRKGVRPGEEVVTTGSFLLKTETLKESIGAGCCDAD